MIWLLAATVVLVLVGSYLAYSKMRGRLDTTLHLGLSSKGAPRPETPNEIELVVLNKSEIAKDTGIEIELFHHVKNQRASSGRMHVSPSLTLKPGAEYRHVLAKIEGGPLRDRKLQLSANGSSYPGLPMRAITIECLLTADSSRPIQRFHVLTTDLAKIDLMEFKPRKPEAKH